MNLSSTPPSVRPTPQRIWLGLAISPPIATGFGIIVLLAVYESAPIRDVAATAIAIAPLGYVCELIFALPLYVLAKRSAGVGLWHLLGFGAIAGGLLSVLMTLVMFPARGTSLAEGLVGLSANVVPLGAAVGLVLWLCAYRKGRS